MSIKTVARSTPFYHSHSYDDKADPHIDLILKVSIFSKLDPKIEITHWVWCATLVVDKAKSRIVPTTFHVRMIIEGVQENSGPFFQIAHLQGPKTWRNPQEISNCWFGWSKSGKVQPGKMIPLSEKPLSLKAYRSKTPTWARSREKIELMIQKIKDEAKNSDKNLIPFSFFGKRSFLTKETEFFTTSHPALLELQQKNPKRFVELYHLYEEEESKINGTFVPKLLGHPIDSAAIKFIKAGAEWIENDDPKTWLEAVVTFPLRITKEILGLAVIAISLPYLPRVMYCSIKTSKNRITLGLMKQNVKKITVLPNNCLTWAAEKLEMADVKIPACWLDRFISISTLYANQPIEVIEKKK